MDTTQGSDSRRRISRRGLLSGGLALGGGLAGVRRLLRHSCIPPSSSGPLRPLLKRLCEELHDTTRAPSISHYGKFIFRVSVLLMV